jgi:hypothetical protein
LINEPSAPDSTETISVKLIGSGRPRRLFRVERGHGPLLAQVRGAFTYRPTVFILGTLTGMLATMAIALVSAHG